MSRQAGTASFEKITNYNKLKKSSNFNVNTKNSTNRTRKSSHVVKSSDNLFENNTSEYFKRIDDYEGLFTTQQLENVDFSEFKNHVFFDSAVSKVYYSYEKILNEFPYDKSEYSYRQYFNKMCGFTRYVYDNFIPKNKGYLNFDGNNEVLVKDFTGNILNDYNDTPKVGLVDLNKKRFSFDFWLYVNDVNSNQELGTQIVFQKKFNNEGITIFLNNFQEDLQLNKKYCDINLFISKDESYFLCKGSLEIGKFCHVNFSSYTAKGVKTFKFYNNGIRSKAINSGSFSKNLKFSEDFKKSVFYIGNGRNHNFTRDSSLDVIKTSGLVGIIDEFRFFVGNRSDDEIIEEKQKNVYSNSLLSIYYKFNEPNTEYLNNNIVLDYSGHKTNGIIMNSNGSQYTEQQISVYRTLKENIDTPLIYEKENDCPIIFARYGNILNDQNVLLKKAKEYDKVNPNIFYNFFPKNIFVNESDFSGNNEIYASEELIYADDGQKLDLLNVKKPEENILIRLITIWARFFDQLKCYIDQISTIIDINYESLNGKKNQSSIIIPYAVSKLGFNFEEIFPSPILEKLNNKNLSFEENVSEKSIRQIQNNLWKRFLINSQDYIKSKGTKKSIKSVFNSFGLDADSFISIREFNSQNKLNIYPGFKEKLTALRHIDFFENNIVKSNIVYDVFGLPENRVFFESKLFNNQVLFNLEENWSIETFCKFDHLKTKKYDNKQSIFRLDVDVNGEQRPYVNIVFERDKLINTKGRLKIYVNEVNQNNEIKISEINDVNILSGKIYYICVTRKKLTDSYSEYVMSVSSSDFGSRLNTLREVKCIVNIEGKNLNLGTSYLRIGTLDSYSQTIKNNLSNLEFENNFEGKLIGLRAWNKVLSDKEKVIHKTDFTCTGSDNSSIMDSLNNLKVNINFEESYTGFINNIVNNSLSIVNNVEDSEITADLKIHQNYTWEKFINVIDHIVYRQSNLIDYPEDVNRVNINSFEDEKLNKEFNNDLTNPSYETYSNFSDFDDIRVSIDFSASKFINEEISKLILVNDYFTQNLSNRSNLYADGYQSLHELKNVFYKKLEKEINIKQMYQIYKYFDNILEKLLSDAIPSKVHYQGFNFVYESSIAERCKYQYKMSNSRFAVIDSNIDFTKYNTRYREESYWNNSEIRTSSFNNTDNSEIIVKTPFK